MTAHSLTTTDLPRRNGTGSSGAAGHRRAAVRTLPLRLQPVAGESIESWLEAWASCNGVAWGEMLSAVGLHAENGRLRVPHFTVSLTQDQLEAISYATGVSAQVISSMISSSLFVSATADSVTAGTFALPRSRFCPRCLADSGGRWQLWWKLRWAFACPVHRCLLADVCPHCLGDQRRRPLPLSLAPQPGACTCRARDSWGRSLQRCGALLSSAPVMDLPAGHPALAAQDYVLAVLDAGSASAGIYTKSPVSSLQCVTDITVVAQQILWHARTDDIRARVPKDVWNIHENKAVGCSTPGPATTTLWLAHDSSATMAVAACAALPVLQAPTRDAAARQLVWLTASKESTRFATAATAIGWGRQVSSPVVDIQSSILAAFLGPFDQLRNRCFAVHPRRPNRPKPIHQWVPGWLWPRCASVFDVPGLSAGQVRTALSVSLLLVGSGVSVHAACAQLGSVTNAYAVSRVLSVLSARSDWAATASVLTSLADLVGGGRCPIDYERRRKLCVTDFLGDREWSRLCRGAQMPVDDLDRADLCRWWLHERLTGSPARRCLATSEDRRFWRLFINLPATLTAEDVAVLDDYGRAFLDAHGMASEPLRWQPPRDALGIPTDRENTWRGVDIDRLHQLIRVSNFSVEMAASALTLSVDVVRETLNDHPAPHQPRAARGAVFGVARADLPRDLFIDLYCRLGQSLWEIALIAGVSQSAVGRLAREYGIPLRPPLSRPARQ